MHIQKIPNYLLKFVQLFCLTNCSICFIFSNIYRSSWNAYLQVLPKIIYEILMKLLVLLACRSILKSQFQIHDIFFFILMVAGVFIHFLPKSCWLSSCRTNKKIIPVLISGYERFDDVSSKEGSASSNKLELGTINFQREVIKELLMLIVVMFWMGHPTKLDI